MTKFATGERWSACLMALALAACGGVPGDPVGAGSTGSGGPSDESGGVPTGDGGATSTDTGGPDRAICDAFLECIAAAVPGMLADSEASFGPNSACWEGLPETIEQCLGACTQGLASYGKLFPDEPACNGGGDGTTGESSTTGPACGEPLPNGESCSPADCPCASGKCRPYAEIGGICSECLDDGDCPAGGACVWTSTGLGAVCRASGPGESCLEDATCVDPSAPFCADLIGFDTCSECRTDDDCPAQEPVCTPVLDDWGGNLGMYRCGAIGSVPLHGNCPLNSQYKHEACATGLCAQVTEQGFKFGICSECNINGHCQAGEVCLDASVDLDTGKMTGGVCL